MDEENTNEQQAKLKPKKPRTEAQIAALERARLRAKEMRATRFKDTPEPDDSDDEPASEREPASEPASEPEPDEPVAEPVAEKPKKPKAKPRTIKPKAPKAKPIDAEPVEPVEPEREREREPEEVKAFRKEIQESPIPTPKEHFRMVHSFKKSYLMYYE